MLLLPGSHAAAASRRGSTLMLSLLATIVVVSLSAIFLQLTSSVAKRQGQAADQKRSFYLAEAGLAEAFAGLRSGKSGALGSAAEPARYGNGLLWVTASDQGDNLIALESTGMCGSTLSKLSLVVSKGAASVAALGVFSAGDLTIGSGSSLTFYDSAETPLAGGSPSGGSGWQQGLGTTTTTTTTTGKILELGESEGRVTLHKDIGSAGVARVGSNGNILITQNTDQLTQVLGDLRPGLGRTLTLNGSPTITGSQAPLSTPVKLPAVSIPVYAQNPGYLHAQPAPLVLPAVNGSYEFLGVASGSEVTITGPSVLVLNQLVVNPGAEITFDTESGPISIYITNKLNFKSGSSLQVTSASPLDLNIQISGSVPAEARASADFHGTLYAPSAEIIVEQDFHIFGSVVANQLTLEGACQLSFDAALGRAAERDALPVLVSWRIMEMNPNAAPGGDPFAQLGVLPANLEAPSSAHRDQILELAYMDSAGIQQSFSGWESDFNWTQVTQVLNLTRDGTSTGLIEGLAGIGAIGKGTGSIGLGGEIKPEERTPARTEMLKGF